MDIENSMNKACKKQRSLKENRSKQHTYIQNQKETTEIPCNCNEERQLGKYGELTTLQDGGLSISEDILLQRTSHLMM